MRLIVKEKKQRVTLTGSDIKGSVNLIAVAIKAKTFVCLEEQEETELIGEPSGRKSELPKCQKQTQNSHTHPHKHKYKHM